MYDQCQYTIIFLSYVFYHGIRALLLKKKKEDKTKHKSEKAHSISSFPEPHSVHHQAPRNCFFHSLACTHPDLHLGSRNFLPDSTFVSVHLLLLPPLRFIHVQLNNWTLLFNKVFCYCFFRPDIFTHSCSSLVMEKLDVVQPIKTVFDGPNYAIWSKLCNLVPRNVKLSERAKALQICDWRYMQAYPRPRCG